jgi:superkiller protein 3
MLAALEEARLRQAEFWEEHSNSPGAPPRYTEAFREYGLDVEALPADQAAGRVRQAPIREELVAALDDWARCLPSSGPSPAKLRAVADGADDNSWRRAVRAAVPRKEAARLKELAKDAGALAQPPAVLVLLGIALVQAQAPEEAVAFLRQAQRRYPGDFWINHTLAVTLSLQRPTRSAEAMGYHRAAQALRPLSPGAHVNLGHALRARGDLAGAAACYRRALELDPKNVRARTGLGNVLRDQGDRDGAVACFRQAIELDPTDVVAHNGLGGTLYDRGDLAGAVACYRRALELNPNVAQVHTNLGIALRAQGDRAGALSCYRRAVELDPKDANAHNDLGHALWARGDRAAAIACFRKAIEINPKHAKAHLNLGVALRDQGERGGAVACLRKAAELDPQWADPHNELGAVLAAQGDRAGAAASFRKAIELNLKHAGAHFNLGLTLRDQGDWAGAAACFRRAVELNPADARAHTNLGAALGKRGDAEAEVLYYRKALEIDPKDVNAHYDLGIALGKQGDLAGAAACYRKALTLDPQLAEAHCNLGHLLRRQGEFAASLAALRAGHELGSARKGWRYPSGKWVQEAERLAELEARLDEVLRGKRQPADAAERVELAQVCKVKKLYAPAARLYAEAFAAGGRTAEDLRAAHRYSAACYAALAAAGQGRGSDKPDAEGCARLRHQALDWLRADLALRARQLGGKPADREELQRRMRHWQRDADLAGVRDAAALAKLPAGEREAWQKFWAEVADLRQKAAVK